MSDGENTPLIEPDEYARLVRDASDEDLERGLEQNGELIIEQIFQAMPSRLRPHATAGVSLVADWIVRDAGSGADIRWQLVIDDGACTVQRDGQLPADVTYTIKGIDFVRLVTGNAHGPRLFLFGRLKIRGDLLKAARLQGYFSAAQARPGG